jgi:hypothetical protein
MDSSFKDAIREHLELKKQNRWIEPTMPISRYRTAELTPELGGDQDLSTGPGGSLEPDGPVGWPTAEGLGLERSASLWAGSSDESWVDSIGSGRRSAA